jgi:hypothetical protein
MPLRKRNTPADFGDILASFDRRVPGDAPASGRAAGMARPEAETEAAIEPAGPPSSKNRLRQLLGALSLPWPNGIGGLIGGFGPRPPVPYDEEPAEREAEPPPCVAQKSGVAKLEAAKTEDQVIAEELGLRPDLATADLQRIRRDFAKKNHPDRFDPARRSNAARRMSIANMLIDAQIRQSHSPRA